MPENNEVIIFYLVAIVLSLFFVGFIIAFALLYKRQQNKLLIEKELEESQLKNQILRKEIQRAKAVQLERQRISQDLHDEIGAGLSAIKLQAEFLKKKDGIEALSDIVEDTQSMTASMKEIVWSLNSTYDTLDSFADYTRKFAIKFFENCPSSLVLDIDDLPELEMGGLVRRNIFLIIKEALHNIIKHSQASEAKLSLKLENEHLWVEIKDNGVGMQTDNELGNGLQNMRNRANAINADFSITSQDSITSIEINSPLLVE